MNYRGKLVLWNSQLRVNNRKKGGKISVQKPVLGFLFSIFEIFFIFRPPPSGSVHPGHGCG
jgi:hypothetical protein